MTRKQFVNIFIRSTILAGMAGMVAVFVSKDKIGTSSECGIDFQCRKCNKLRKCALPEAINFRSDGKG